MSLLNKEHTKKFILETLQKDRPGWPATRISANVYLDLDRYLRQRIREGIHRHPTLGKTVMELK